MALKCCKHKRRQRKQKISNVEPEFELTVKKNDDQQLVLEWLKHELDLEQYYPLFVENGYNSMKAIATIENVSTLSKLGITKIGHQQFIMTHIKEIRKQSMNSNHLQPSQPPKQPYFNSNPSASIDVDDIEIDIEQVHIKIQGEQGGRATTASIIARLKKLSTNSPSITANDKQMPLLYDHENPLKL